MRNLQAGNFFAAFVAALASCGADAADSLTLRNGWPPRLNRIGTTEAAVMGVLAAGAISLEFLVNPPATARWDRPILFDADARSALRAGSQAGRNRAGTASDIGYFGLPVYAFAVDSGLVTWLGRDQGDAALQLALINAEALVINGLLTRIAQKAAGRRRPDAVETTTDNTAFLSGHTSTAFCMASALCVQHGRLEIYGDVADRMVCPAALTVAGGTGLLRIVADRHWASDVIAGAVLGSAVGATVSWAHLRGNTESPAPTLSVGPGGRSLFYGGSF